MNRVVRIAAVEDNRMLVDCLWAWASGSPGIRLTAVTSTVDELLRAGRGPVNVVLLDAALRAGPDPGGNVRRLIGAGHRVLMAYGSGRILDSTARHLGITVETARTYLKRVRAKYKRAGLPAYTKEDFSERVRADWQEEPDHGRPLTKRRVTMTTSVR